MLGKGNVQKNAIAEFKSLPGTTQFKDKVLELLSNLFAMLDVQNLDSEERELIMELSSLYLERIKNATERGIERGIEREAVSFVMRLLNRRFGSIAPDIEQKIRNLPVNRLEDLGEALLDFQSITDLRNWLEQAN